MFWPSRKALCVVQTQHRSTPQEHHCHSEAWWWKHYAVGMVSLVQPGNCSGLYSWWIETKWRFEFQYDNDPEHTIKETLQWCGETFSFLRMKLWIPIDLTECLWCNVKIAVHQMYAGSTRDSQRHEVGLFDFFHYYYLVWTLKHFIVFWVKLWDLMKPFMFSVSCPRESTPEDRGKGRPYTVFDGFTRLLGTEVIFNLPSTMQWTLSLWEFLRLYIYLLSKLPLTVYLVNFILFY